MFKINDLNDLSHCHLMFYILGLSPFPTIVRIVEGKRYHVTMLVVTNAGKGWSHSINIDWKYLDLCISLERREWPL